MTTRKTTTWNIPPCHLEILEEAGEVPNLDGDRAVAGLVPEDDADTETEAEEARDAGPGPLEPLSRTSTRSLTRHPFYRTNSTYSSAVASSAGDEEEDAETPRAEAFPSSYGSPGVGRRPSRQFLRRKSSVPVGMGMGFRRLSSNMGQSNSGYGHGAGLQ